MSGPAAGTGGLIKLAGSNLRLMLGALPGSQLFKHLMVEDGSGVKFDAAKEGEISCALVVSSLLSLVNLIDAPHATVSTTLSRMAEVGWRRTDSALLGGEVVVWPPNARGHMHIGFYLGEGRYVSNSESEGYPVEHGPALKDGRLPIEFYSHPQLAN